MIFARAENTISSTGSPKPPPEEVLLPPRPKLFPSGALESRDSLRTRHPEVLGLPEKLIADGAVPCSTVLEASWLYAAAVDECRQLPSRPTAAAKLGCLVEATKKLAAATAGRTSELSADDLVPLTAMLLVAAALPSLDFEAYVLAELLADALATGPEAYCVCTMRVAAGFLAEVVVV